jgi:hypothetical protein
MKPTEEGRPMSDDVIPPPEPEEVETRLSDPLPAGIDRDRVAEDLAALVELAAAGVEVDGEVQVAESTWFLYGHASYDGEIVVGEYHDAVEAEEVLRAAPRPHPDPDPDE